MATGMAWAKVCAGEAATWEGALLGVDECAGDALRESLAALGFEADPNGGPFCHCPRHPGCRGVP